jgi:mono/diheme cytochrome c family protein
MTRWGLIGAAALGLGGTLAAATLALCQGREDGAAANAIGRGRYLVTIGGCNDCHTPEYVAKTGDVPEGRWLIGDSVGFSGPWGTTYPTNLRSFLRKMSEDEWVHFARGLRSRPPMPWFNLRAMTDGDLRAIHAYVRSMPVDDSPVPDHVPPDRQPQTPHIVFVPQAPKR